MQIVDFILSRWSFPSVEQWLIVFPLGLMIGSGAGWITAQLKASHPWPVGYTRKIFHFLIFTSAGMIGLLRGFEAVQVFGGAMFFVVGYAVLKGRRSNLYNALARPNDSPHETFYIVVPFLMTALGGMTSNLLFGEFAVLGYIATGWGDAVGEPVGTRWGKHRYPVLTLTGIKSTRSIEGSCAVFFAAWLGSLLWLSVGFDLTLWQVTYASFLVALTTMVVEAITFHSLDNFTIQVTAAWVGYCLITLEC